MIDKRCSLPKNTALKSPKLKVERAKTLIKEIEELLNLYTSSVNLSLNRGSHPETSIHNDVIILKAEEEIPDNIASITGDALHNMRSALDHLTCCLAIKNNKTMCGVSFPFDETKDAFEKSSITKIKKLSIKAQNKIRALKPYGGGNDFLYSLSQLNNRDKHRTILLASLVYKEIEGEFSCDHPIQVSTNWIGSLHQGIHLFTLPKEAKFEHNTQVTFSVALNEANTPMDKALVDVLNDFLFLVENIISDFEKDFF